MFSSNVFVGEVTISGVADRGPGMWNYILKGSIYVNNLSFNKRVGFRIRANGQWIDLLALYSRSLLTGGGNSLEVWEYNTGVLFSKSDLLKPLKTFQFAVFYDNLDWGTSYWDNNFGQDYFVTAIGS
jgi:hypothetical protein